MIVGASAASGASSPDATLGEGGWSFARVTAMNGHFPTLEGKKGPAPTTAAAVTTSTATAGGAWGVANSVAASSTSGGGAGGGSVWGTPKTEAGSGASGDNGETPGNRVSASDGKKRKGKKSKGVSLFSNAGVRGGR